MTTNNRSNVYFAQLPEDEIGDALVEKVDDYRGYLLKEGLMRVWKRLYDQYYKGFWTGAQNYRTGEQSQYVNTTINHFRNLILHLKSMTTQQRPAFEPKAVNTDVRSTQQVILAEELLEYYLRQKRLEDYLRQACEWCLLTGEGFVACKWDAHAGEQFGLTPEGTPIMEGDMVFSVFDGAHVVRDVTKKSWQDNDWVITISWRNRYDEAAKYPERASEIIGLSANAQDLKEYEFLPNYLEDTDDIPVYHFYHRPTSICPQGRYVKFLDQNIVLIDSNLPYREIPLYRITPEEQLGSPWGYSISMDLLPIQQDLDVLYSTVLTNQQAFGVQNIVVKKGAGPIMGAVVNGMRFIEVDEGGEPKPLQLTATAPEIFEFMKELERLAETISAVNSVARGNPNENLKSGAALALVQSMAIQFTMNLQQNWAQLIERLGTAMINLLKDFAKSPRTAEIVGKSNQMALREFTSNDLSEINRVIVDMGNPATATIAGRMNMADALLQHGLIQDAEQYMLVYKTGNLDNMTEARTQELALIRAENERLSTGQSVRAVMTDLHTEHIMEHRSVLTADMRDNPNSPAAQATMSHIMEHLNMLKTGDPEMLKMFGQPSLAPPPPQPPQPPAQPAQVLVQPAPPAPQPNPGASLPQPPHPTATGQGHVPPQKGQGMPAMQPVNPVAAMNPVGEMLQQASKIKLPHVPKSPLDRSRPH